MLLWELFPFKKPFWKQMGNYLTWMLQAFLCTQNRIPQVVRTTVAFFENNGSLEEALKIQHNLTPIGRGAKHIFLLFPSKKVYFQKKQKN